MLAVAYKWLLPRMVREAWQAASEIEGQAINEQQISPRAFLPEGAVETRGDLDGLPRRRSLATVLRYLGSHLRVIPACRSNKDDSLEGGGEFLRVATLSVMRSTQYEGHRLRWARLHASRNLAF
jgi:hypothetical protein